MRKRRFARFCAAFTAFIIGIMSVSLVGSGSNYSDKDYQSYGNLSENSDIPSLFKNDEVMTSYKDYPPVICDGEEYVPLVLFQDLSNIKVNYSDDRTNFYIQNKKTNKYISFSINDDYAVTRDNKVFQTTVYTFYGVHYVPLKTVCSNVGIGYSTYNDSENKIFAIKVYTGEKGLSAKELVAIYAPHIYSGSNNPDTSAGNITNGEASTNNQTPKPPEYKNGTVMLFFMPEGFANAQKTLKTLASKRLHATFFVTESDILTYPDIIRSIYTSGHTIGITFDTEDTQLYNEGVLEERVKSAEAALYEVAKTKTRIVYLPKDEKGECDSERINSVIESLGLCRVVLNADSKTDRLSRKRTESYLREVLLDIRRNFGSDTAYMKMSHTDSGNYAIGVIADVARSTSKVKVRLFDETFSK